ncbi:MAG: hypothetical protein CMO81_08935 [Waddliaceae bacterium]|nr:hypothetical protein [Waddliaceae bacterium]
MAAIVIPEKTRSSLSKYLKASRNPELVNVYLYFLEQLYGLHPVVFPQSKMIYRDSDEVVRVLEGENRLWKETEIKIGYYAPSVNEETSRIYICPFSGKVFGDNTHPNPQDAIYDWVSKCPENTERVGGLRVKRFYVSEDPEVIKGYADKDQHKKGKGITKVVYSSALSGKLFSTRKAVVADFQKNYLKRLSLVEVQNQNRFQIEDKFLAFIKEHLSTEKLTSFVEALADYEEFMPYVEQWIDGEEE